MSTPSPHQSTDRVYDVSVSTSGARNSGVPQNVDVLSPCRIPSLQRPKSAILTKPSGSRRRLSSFRSLRAVTRAPFSNLTSRDSTGKKVRQNELIVPRHKLYSAGRHAFSVSSVGILEFKLSAWFSPWTQQFTASVRHYCLHTIRRNVSSDLEI